MDASLAAFHRFGLPATAALALAGALLGWAGTVRAEQSFPFDGTWVRADRVCSANAPSARTYTPRELVLANGRCALRKVAFGSGEWELFEDCRRPEHQGRVTEKIRILGPDMILIKQQVVRLKIPRGRRFARCNLAGAPKPAPTPPPGRSFPIPAAPKP